jgi:hypothetical protein
MSKNILKNILKTASVLSAFLVLMTACGGDKTKEDDEAKNKSGSSSSSTSSAFLDALPAFGVLKSDLKKDADEAAIDTIATNWVKPNGPWANNAIPADIKKVLDAKAEIFALSKLKLTQDDGDATTKAFEALSKKVSLADLKTGADGLGNAGGLGKLDQVPGFVVVAATGGEKAALTANFLGVFFTKAEAVRLFEVSVSGAAAAVYSGDGSGKGTNGDDQELYQITYEQARKVKAFAQAVSSFASDAQVIALEKSIKE